MNDLRAAAQQALEALESVDGAVVKLLGALSLQPDADSDGAKVRAAIAAIRAALDAPQGEPVAWAGYDLDGMVEAFHRVIEAHADKRSPFHQPTNADAMTALRILRGLIPAMKAYATPPQRVPQGEPAAGTSSRAEAMLRDALQHAEWHDKHIHPCNGETFQTWCLTIYLPVPLSATDKSPKAALARALSDLQPEGGAT